MIPRRFSDARERIGLRPAAWLCATAFVVILVGAAPCEAGAKRKPAYQPQPDLRIVSVTPSRDPYTPQQGPLDLAIEVELPKDVDGATVLEVSSLISSPSKTSMRFLVARQPVASTAAERLVQTGSSADDAKPRLSLTLSWDGTDLERHVVPQGRYQYEVRAKLLAVIERESETGMRTHMVSWPKRGTLEVK
jgi:hypothetical protein